MSAKKKIEHACLLMQQGAFEAALKVAKTVRPHQAEYAKAQGLIADAHYNIGVMLLRLQSWEGARDCFREAIAVHAQHDEALNNLGGLALMQHQYESAIGYYQRALAANPRRYDTWLDMAHCYENTGQISALHEEIYPAMRRIFPQDGAIAMREALSTAPIMLSQADIEYSRSQTQERLNALIQTPKTIDNPLSRCGTYFYFTYHGVPSKSLNESVAKAYLAACPNLAWRSPHVAGWSALELVTRRIRLGVVSSHLYDHSVGISFARCIKDLDRARFEVHIIHLGASPRDAVYESISESADGLHHFDSPDLTTLQQAVAALALDILFYPDIGMSPASYFLAFARLAPVQITSFGHPDTTGIPTLDYYISAKGYEPPDAQAHYSETLCLVDDDCMLTDYAPPSPPSGKGRADFGLPEEAVLLLCPQTLFKIHPDMRLYWRDCLLAIPEAKLVLVAPAQSAWRAALETQLQALEPQLLDRVVWVPRQARYADYAALLRCADLVLDNLHFNGYNTNLDVLSVDTPIVTQASALQRGRVTAAMLRALGLEELVATGAEEFVQIVQRLTRDPDYRAQVRARIAAHKSSLFHRSHITREFERIFIEALGHA